MSADDIIPTQADQHIQGLFSSISSNYDRLNHILSLGLDLGWVAWLARSIGKIPDGPICDLASGTGAVTRGLRRIYPDRKLISVDLCLDMLLQGLRHADSCSVNASAFNLPLKSASFAAMTVAFGIRNMRPRKAALAEIHRVLKPGGRFCVLEFSPARQSRLLGLYNFYLNAVLPRVGGWLSGDRGAYEYLARSIRKFPDSDDFRDELAAAGFTNIELCTKSFGIVQLFRCVKSEKRSDLASAPVSK